MPPVSAAVDATPSRAPGEVREQAPQIARARAVAVTRTAPSRRLQPGDRVCGSCGEGNAQSRSFCSRCGASLVEAVTVKEPWWRRFVPRRGPRVVRLAPDTGGGTGEGTSAAHLAKPGLDLKSVLRQIYRKGRIVAAVVVLCAGAIYGAYPPFRNTVDAKVRSLKAQISNTFAAQLSPIHAVSVKADPPQPDHPAQNAADELLNTYWLAPYSASSPPTLTFTFDHHVTIKRIILQSGASDAYIQNGRPSQLILHYSNGESFSVFPQDTSQAQTFSISHANLITSMQIQVGAVYQGTGGASTAAITEIELFGLTT